MDSETKIPMELHKKGSWTAPSVCSPPRPFPYAKTEAAEGRSLSLTHGILAVFTNVAQAKLA